MIYVYAIKSIKRNYIYMGMTDNLQRRISQHENGYEKTTKPYRPFVLIHHEKFSTRGQASLSAEASAQAGSIVKIGY